MNVEDERESLEISFTVQPIVNNRNVKKKPESNHHCCADFHAKAEFIFFLFHLQIYFLWLVIFNTLRKLLEDYFSKEILMC